MYIDDNVEVGNPTLEQSVDPENELKEWLINYVGEKYNPPEGRVTVEMIVNAISIEFPEFLMCVAEENWIRGYTQGLEDSTQPMTDVPTITGDDNE